VCACDVFYAFSVIITEKPRQTSAVVTGFADTPNVRQAHTTTEKNVRDDIAQFKRQAMGNVQVTFNSAPQKPV
jgi:hypothetical protein